MKTRNVTDYLKGLAIIAVVVDHFSLHYADRFYNPYIGGNANGLLVFFFLFSGFGLFYSMERRFAAPGSFWKNTGRFLAERAVRIYPLYWAALVITSYLQPQFEELHTRAGLIYYLALPYPHPPRLFWFVASIVECYIVAPLFFAVLTRFGLKLFLPLTAALAAIFFPLSLMLAEDYSIYVTTPMWGFIYKYFFLGNIVLFALGMVMAVIFRRHEEKFRSKIVLAGSLAVMIAGLHYSRLWSKVFDHSMTYFAVILFAAAFFFSLYAISLRPPLPFGRVVALAGRHSYPLYLFHLSFFGALVHLGLLEPNDWRSGIAAVVLLPLLLFFCMQMEKSVAFAKLRARLLLAGASSQA